MGAQLTSLPKKSTTVLSAVMQYSPDVVIEFSPPFHRRRETMEFDGARETTIMPLNPVVI